MVLLRRFKRCGCYWTEETADGFVHEMQSCSECCEEAVKHMIQLMRDQGGDFDCPQYSLGEELFKLQNESDLA